MVISPEPSFRTETVEDAPKQEASKSPHPKEIKNKKLLLFTYYLSLFTY
jgi:hypothetical protein